MPPSEIEKWFFVTYKESGRSPEEAQLLNSFKLHQLDERLMVVEGQTRNQWSNSGMQNLIFIKCMFIRVSF